VASIGPVGRRPDVRIGLCALDHAPRRLHSFPTRRSSDLLTLPDGRYVIYEATVCSDTAEARPGTLFGVVRDVTALRLAERERTSDRKSTRLNSSHVKISYAVFCLKKKISHRQQRQSATVV